VANHRDSDLATKRKVSGQCRPVSSMACAQMVRTSGFLLAGSLKSTLSNSIPHRKEIMRAALRQGVVALNCVCAHVTRSKLKLSYACNCPRQRPWRSNHGHAWPPPHALYKLSSHREPPRRPSCIIQRRKPCPWTPLSFLRNCRRASPSRSRREELRIETCL